MTTTSILFTIPNLDTAGSGRAMARVMRGLEELGFRTAICVNRPGGSLQDDLEAQGVEVLVHPLQVPVAPRHTLVTRARDAAKPLRGRFDIWHSYDYRDDYTEPLLARFAHARWAFTKKNMSWNHRSWWARTVQAKGIAAQNTDMLRDFFRGPVLSRHARYVPRGISLAPPPDPALGLALRAELGIAADAPVIACVAQIIPRKGQHLLVEALPDLPGAHLLLAGAVTYEPYGERVRTAIDRAGVGDRVHWLGHVSDIDPVLAATDVFSLPTGDQAEGCPVALLEAMAAEVAVVATDVPGSRDVVNSDRNGIVVPRDDVPSLAAALRRLLDDPAERATFATAGRQRVADTFTLEAEVAAHAALYREMMGSREMMGQR